MSTRDPTVETVIAEYRARSEAGIANYGCTLADSPGDLATFLQHAKEEAMDITLYLQRAIELAGRCERLEAHFRRMQGLVGRYIQPGPYVDRYGVDWVMPSFRDGSFISDMISMLDGPEQREVENG